MNWRFTTARWKLKRSLIENKGEEKVTITRKRLSGCSIYNFHKKIEQVTEV